MGHSLHKMGAFFEERAKGQVGLMVTGGIAPNSEGRLYPFAAALMTPADAARHRVVEEGDGVVHTPLEALGVACDFMEAAHACRWCPG